jgi:WD40 repeat protein
MLGNHIKKFTINTNIPELNSNINEIIKEYNFQGKDLKINYYNNFFNSTKETLETNLNQAYQTFFGHKEKIISIIQLSSGKLASGSYDKTIRIWNIHLLNEEKIINEKGKVFCLLEFEKDKLLCGTSENVINLWDLNSKENKCISSFYGHDLWINGLVKCNENYFASASNDRTIKIWDYFNRKIYENLVGHRDCVLSLILLKNNNLCSGSADNTIKIWDWENGVNIKTLKGHEGWVKCVFELSNRIILSGGGDKTIKLWKDYQNIRILDKHEHAVRTFCQINNNYFASGSFDSTIKI